MVGAGTWPGAGVNAISGRLVAAMIAGERRRKGRIVGAGVALGAAAAVARAAMRRRR
jgi:hypothetical protein